ncbi:MAG: DUF1385 domain-containing protein [Nanoarchaeota archaeon]|nr:DUF1385 domain-containing protein [Nanoarchaeota archaeon]MBU1644413.1 DUF1385 domain-containing protein [Nanoarchaeota archaeon]MBU1977503.1 DUF1385 domain-containing protein [Nanoarchaeota archaeon]
MNVGGQAVIEGVMMRNKEKFAVAVRLPNGKIKIKKEKSSSFPNLFNVFFLRGVVGLGYTLYDGVRALIWSSNQNLGKEEKLSKKEIIGTVFFSMLFSILIFVAVPFFSARMIHSEGFLFNLLDGFFRVALFIGYLLGISYMSDVKTLFQYHGAEHKSIHCYENGKELTVKNVKEFSRLHPRCGTSFLFVVLLLSIFVFTIILGPWWVKLSGRVILLPAIAGISYELIKLSDKFKDNSLVKALITPGLWLQKITTKEPTDKQLEVGIASLKAVVK